MGLLIKAISQYKQTTHTHNLYKKNAENESEKPWKY